MRNIILIEGLDLVGKTTLCEKLVEKYPDEFIYKKSTYSNNNDIYDETVRKSKTGNYSDETIAWMYIAAARNELDLINKEKDENMDKIIIQDSFFLNRMIGVHGITDRKTLIKAIDELVGKFEMPQQTYYIYSDIDTRQKRFMDRQSIKKPAFGDKLVFEDRQKAILREGLFRMYITKKYNAKVIDNSNINIDELLNKLYSEIKEKIDVREGSEIE